jgi:hypothetical protein
MGRASSLGPVVRSLLLLALCAANCRGADRSPQDPPTRGKRKLLLFAKNPATWSIIKGGGSGKLVYREATGVFSLHAEGVRPRSPYALIRYADSAPRGEVVARGMSDGRGKLELSGIWRNWSKKFWLVAGEDVAGSVGGAASMRGWHPDRYLFEEKQLGIACACPEPEEP